MFQGDVGGSGVEEVASVCFSGFGGGGAAADEDGDYGEEREEDGGGDDGDGYGEELGCVVSVVRFVVGWEDEGGDVGGESGE